MCVCGRRRRSSCAFGALTGERAAVAVVGKGCNSVRVEPLTVHPQARMLPLQCQPVSQLKATTSAAPYVQPCVPPIAPSLDTNVPAPCSQLGSLPLPAQLNVTAEPSQAAAGTICCTEAALHIRASHSRAPSPCLSAGNDCVRHTENGLHRRRPTGPAHQAPAAPTHAPTRHRTPPAARHQQPRPSAADPAAAAAAAQSTRPLLTFTSSWRHCGWFTACGGCIRAWTLRYMTARALRSDQQQAGSARRARRRYGAAISSHGNQHAAHIPIP